MHTHACRHEPKNTHTHPFLVSNPLGYQLGSRETLWGCQSGWEERRMIMGGGREAVGGGGVEWSEPIQPNPAMLLL